MVADASTPTPLALRDLALLFLKLGTIAFGGPAAHIAMIRDEAVVRRKWLRDEEFLDLLGATNLIPGPNSTEMAIHIGYLRAGWRGLLVAGASFIAPAALIVTGLAWAYVQYGATPEATWLLYGVKPVIIVIVAKALWDLGKAAVKDSALAATGAVAFALYLLGINEIVLLGGGALVMAWRNRRRTAIDQGPGHSRAKRVRSRVVTPATIAVVGLVAAVTSIALLPVASGPPSLSTLFLTFLKIGSVLYGSGYVLLAFLRNDFVVRLGWLTNDQLLDAVAVGQITPGPVFTTATFIGYLAGGPFGALLATLGIFLPAFVFAAAVNPWVPRLRNSRWAAGLLDGVNVTSVGLMAAVSLVLGLDAVVDAATGTLAILAGLLLFRYRVNTTWLIAGGAAFGLALYLLGFAPG
jgi:chromate transporter